MNQSADPADDGLTFYGDVNELIFGNADQDLSMVRLVLDCIVDRNRRVQGRAEECRR